MLKLRPILILTKLLYGGSGKIFWRCFILQIKVRKAV